MKLKSLEYLGINDARTNVYSPFVSKFLDIDTSRTASNIDKLLLTVIGTSGKRIVTGLECFKHNDTQVRITPGVAVKDLVVLYINDEDLLMDIPFNVSGTFYIVIRYNFKAQLPSDDVDLLFVTPSTYNSNSNIYLYLCTVKIVEDKIDNVVREDSLFIPPIETIPYYLRFNVSDIMNEVYTKRELQISGLSQVHWDNITNKPDVLSIETLTWENIENKPTTFPPTTHNHDGRYYTVTQLQTTGQALVNWTNLFNVPSSFPPTLHDHDNRYYTKLQLVTPNNGDLVDWTNVANRPISLPPTTHNHDDRYYTITQLTTPNQSQIHWDNISNKPLLLTGSLNLDQYVTHIQLSVEGNSEVHWNNITNKPFTFSPSFHIHDDRYYTTSQLQTPDQAQVHWLNITNKPTSFPVDNHDHNLLYYTIHQLQTPNQSRVHWDNIINKPMFYNPATHTHDNIYYTKADIDYLFNNMINSSGLLNVCNTLYFWKTNGEQDNIILNSNCTISFWKTNGEKENIPLGSTISVG